MERKTFKQDKCKSYLKELHNKKIRKMYEKKCKSNVVDFGNITLITRESVDDGNCFFDSVYRLLNKRYSYRNMLKLRKDISKKFTMKEYLLVNDGLLALETISDYLPHPENIHDTTSLKRQVRGLNKDDKEEVLITLEDNLEDLQSSLKEDGEWAEEWMISFTSKILKVNIVIYNDDAQQFQMVRKINKRYPFILLYNYSETHFEPLVDTDNNKIFRYKDIKEGLINI